MMCCCLLAGPPSVESELFLNAKLHRSKCRARVVWPCTVLLVFKPPRTGPGRWCHLVCQLEEQKIHQQTWVLGLLWLLCSALEADVRMRRACSSAFTVKPRSCARWDPRFLHLVQVVKWSAAAALPGLPERAETWPWGATIRGFHLGHNPGFRI